eukprot:586541-Hanusia_phi.AAC.1
MKTRKRRSMNVMVAKIVRRTRESWKRRNFLVRPVEISNHLLPVCGGRNEGRICCTEQEVRLSSIRELEL